VAHHQLADALPVGSTDRAMVHCPGLIRRRLNSLLPIASVVFADGTKGARCREVPFAD
jgi:hypothetical protein